MEVEIIRDPHEEALATFTPLSEHHEMVPSHWTWMASVRSWAPTLRLFVYRHRLTGRFVLASWVYSPEETALPVMMELETFDGPPDMVWPRGLLDPEVLKCRLQPAPDSVDRMRRRMADRAYAKRATLESEDMQRQDAARYLKRRGMDRESHMLSTGELPFVGKARGGEQLEALTEELKGLARRS